MDTHVLDALQDAIFRKGSIFIKYNGGSQSGTVREVIPTKITGDLVYAYCTLSKANKSFKIEKIDVDGFDDADSYCGAVKSVLESPNDDTGKIISDFVAERLDAFFAPGWCVRTGNSYVWLFGDLLNVRNMNIPSVSLHYKGYNFLGTNNVTAPWCVAAYRMPTEFYVRLCDALAKIDEFARVVPVKTKKRGRRLPRMCTDFELFCKCANPKKSTRCRQPLEVVTDIVSMAQQSGRILQLRYAGNVFSGRIDRVVNEKVAKKSGGGYTYISRCYLSHRAVPFDMNKIELLM